MPMIVAQIGAREHYAMARGLHARGRLQQLITDAWVPPEGWWRRLPGIPGSLQQRYHPALTDAPVTHFTASLVRFEVEARLRRWHGWDRMIQRNRWFQQRGVKALRTSLARAQGPPPVVFSYSYAARELFIEAKKHGCTTVLGQIDAGPYEEQLVQEQHRQFPQFRATAPGAPASYWEEWREETALADVIVVNSQWSQTALGKAGIAEDKMNIVPLMYENAASQGSTHAYPEGFSEQRPLRVLFLGTLTLRKGLAQLLQAAMTMQSAPVEWWMVGDGPATIPDAYRELSSIRWTGRVSRGDTPHYYQQADIFILPTISDGFALTQLEALAHGLPVIASPYCGDVVRHLEHGLRLTDVTPEAIESAVTWCIDNPGQLGAMARQARERVADYRAEVVMPRFLEAAGVDATSAP